MMLWVMRGKKGREKREKEVVLKLWRNGFLFGSSRFTLLFYCLEGRG